MTEGQTVAMQPQQQRGRERRDSLINAATEIAGAEGFAAISHRSVAGRAGVPLGSTTYYFSSLDDLLGAVAGAMVDQCLARGADLIDAAPDGTYDADRAAELLARAVLPGQDYSRVLCYYEQLLGSARHPAVASALGESRPRLERMVARALDKTGYAGVVSPSLVLAVVDGAALSALSEGRRDVVGFAAAVVTELLTPHH